MTLAQAILALCAVADADTAVDACLHAAAVTLVDNCADNGIAEHFITQFRHQLSAARIHLENELHAAAK